MKQHLLSISTLSLILVGCGGPTLSKDAGKYLNANTHYKVNTVNVHFQKSLLNFDKEQSLYPNENELATLLKSDIEKHLREKGLACNNQSHCLNINVNMNYLRHFNLNSNTVGAPTYDRTIKLGDGKKIYYSDTQSNMTVTHGAFGDLAVFTKMGNKKPNLKDEEKDIDLIAEEIVDTIQKSTK